MDINNNNASLAFQSTFCSLEGLEQAWKNVLLIPQSAGVVVRKSQNKNFKVHPKQRAKHCSITADRIINYRICQIAQLTPLGLNFALFFDPLLFQLLN